MVLKRRKFLAIVGGLMALVAAVSSLEAAYRSPPSPYGHAVLESRPLGYWDLGEFHGPTVKNAVGSEPSGQYRGAIGFGTSGAIPASNDTAVQLDYRGGSIVLGESLPDSPDSSIAFWLRPDSGTTLGAIYAAWRPPPEGTTALRPWTVASRATRVLSWTMMFEVPDRLSVDYQTVSGNDAGRLGGTIESGRFNFVVLTFRGGRARLWLDGRPAAERERRIPRLPPQEPRPLTIGGNPSFGLKHFAGTVDDVAFYPRALREGEIRRLWRVARVN